MYATPAQNKLRGEINDIQSKLDALHRVKDTNLSCLENPITEIKKLRKQVDEKKKKLVSIEKASLRAKKFREKTKKLKNTIKERYPELLKNKVHVQNDRGRPNLDEDQPELLKTIARIAELGASASDRRRTEVLRSCKTLDDMCNELNALGFKISRTATYYRFLPKNHNSTAAKRHVKTAPVRLCRPQSDMHKVHVDQAFCKSTIRDLEIIASILGPKQTAFISADDKARVPIGITAAKAQAPFLMHMDYEVRLPDHDFVVAGGHKLIPSVYAAIRIEENSMGRHEAVTYSGPTYIAIRSGKHSSSTAATHASDYQKLYQMKSFDKFLKDDNEQAKPVLIITTDGGPDENPRYPKVISHAIDLFKNKNLDALFWACNAPGNSAFNRVERRMAPLSRQLSGVILPHETFGSHLNSARKTIDKELEKKNFQAAGKILAEVWEDLVIDSYSVEAAYVDPNMDANTPEPWVPSHSWVLNHVKESQYFLQVPFIAYERFYIFYTKMNKIDTFYRLLNVTTNHAVCPEEVISKI